MKAKKIIMLLLSVTLLLQFSTFSSFAASGRVYIFTFDWTNFFDWGDLYTRPSANRTVLQHLWNMGYDAGEYLNNNASAAYSVMSAAKIYAVASHGVPGRLYFGTDSDDISYIYANRTVTGNDRSISNLSSNALSNTRLVLYMTCESGLTSPSYGNLVTSTHSKGAQCTVGWNGSIQNRASNDWIRLFFEKADEDHDVIWECFNHADYWVEDIHGSEDAEELIDRHERGNINQYLYQ